MHRFFAEGKISEGCDFVLTGENMRHLSRSLRAEVGDRVCVCDAHGVEYECTVKSFSRESVVCTALKRLSVSAEPAYGAYLCQALTKSDKMDYIIQKAVELGVRAIIPFESENCVMRLKGEARKRKLERWAKIAESAAKQCGRAVIPEVRDVCSFSEVLALGEGSRRFFLYEKATVPLGEQLDGFTHDDVYFTVGPEGGFSPREAQCAASAGWTGVSLGRRILRTETASLYFLSVLSYEQDKQDNLQDSRE